jgi:hypothetical protein
MQQKIKMLAGIVLVISAAVLVSGCWPFPSSEKVGEKIMEKTIESQTGGKVNVDADKNEMTINSEQGSTTFSGGGNAKLPDNFPNDVFIFDDKQIIMSSSGTSADDFSVSYVTSVSADEVFSKYKSEMVAKGWKKDSDFDIGAQGKMLSFSKSKRRIGVTIGENKDGDYAGKTSILIVGTVDQSGSSSDSGSVPE